MAVNVQAQGAARFGFGSGDNGEAPLGSVYSPETPAFWSALLFVALATIVVLVALSAWERFTD